MVCSCARSRSFADLVFLFVVRFKSSEISCSFCICKRGETESSSEVNSGGNNPIIVIHNDEKGKSIIAVKLNGANYFTWSKFIKLVLRAKKKLKFLLEDPQLEMTADYEDWISADAYVILWLVASMEPHIASNVQ